MIDKMISPKDKLRLRALAANQMEIANSPKMQAIYKDWQRHGAFVKDARPMLTVELWTFADEIIPQMLQCEGEYARKLERKLLANVIPHVQFGDDTPVRDYYQVYLHQEFVPFGLDVKKVDADDSGWAGVGYKFDTYLHDLEADFHKLKKSTFSFDPEGTQKEIDALNEIFGDILPARMDGEPVCVGPAEDIIRLIEMEDLYVAMIEEPELVHKMFVMLLDDYNDRLDELERRKLILPTTSAQNLPQGSYCFANYLKDSGTGLSTRDVWGYMDAEEMNDVSPQMYKEFIVDHYRRMSNRFGALSFACCEAVHNIWDDCIETLPNLRKVSISAWCDEHIMGDRLKGKDIVYLRKPTANLLGIASALDEDAARAHFTHTAKCASGCRLEITQRDVYLLHGVPEKVRRYVEIARECLDQYWKP